MCKWTLTCALGVLFAVNTFAQVEVAQKLCLWPTLQTSSVRCSNDGSKVLYIKSIIMSRLTGPPAECSTGLTSGAAEFVDCRITLSQKDAYYSLILSSCQDMAACTLNGKPSAGQPHIGSRGCGTDNSTVRNLATITMECVAGTTTTKLTTLPTTKSSTAVQTSSLTSASTINSAVQTAKSLVAQPLTVASPDASETTADPSPETNKIIIGCSVAASLVMIGGLLFFFFLNKRGYLCPTLGKYGGRSGHRLEFTKVSTGDPERGNAANQLRRMLVEEKAKISANPAAAPRKPQRRTVAVRNDQHRSRMRQSAASEVASGRPRPRRSQSRSSHGAVDKKKRTRKGRRERPKRQQRSRSSRLSGTSNLLSNAAETPIEGVYVDLPVNSSKQDRRQSHDKHRRCRTIHSSGASELVPSATVALSENVNPDEPVDDGDYEDVEEPGDATEVDTSARVPERIAVRKRNIRGAGSRPKRNNRRKTRGTPAVAETLTDKAGASEAFSNALYTNAETEVKENHRRRRTSKTKTSNCRSHDACTEAGADASVLTATKSAEKRGRPSKTKKKISTKQTSRRREYEMRRNEVLCLSSESDMDERPPRFVSPDFLQTSAKKVKDRGNHSSHKNSTNKGASRSQTRQKTDAVEPSRSLVSDHPVPQLLHSCTIEQPQPEASDTKQSVPANLREGTSSSANLAALVVDSSTTCESNTGGQPDTHQTKRSQTVCTVFICNEVKEEVAEYHIQCQCDSSECRCTGANEEGVNEVNDLTENTATQEEPILLP